MGQQRFPGTSALFQPSRAKFGEVAVPRQMSLGMGLRDVPQLLASHVWLVKRDIVLHGQFTSSRRSDVSRQTEGSYPNG